MIRGLIEMLSRLVSVFRRRALDRDFDEELATHVDLLTAEKERKGLPYLEARRQAILQMGGRNAAQNLQREARGLPIAERVFEGLGAFRGDLVHAARSLAKSRGFTFVCVASLGIGMGTVIAILVFTRGLAAPVASIDAQGLVEILVVREGPLRAQAGDWGSEQWSYPDFAAIRDAETGMEITGWVMGDMDLERADEPAPLVVPTLYVSPNYFGTLGVSLARGPGFDPDLDDRAGEEATVVVGYGFWENRLASDPDIVGKTLTLDDVSHVVVGVAPEGFGGHIAPGETPVRQLFVPLAQHPLFGSDRFNRGVDWVRIHARLSPGVGIEQADDALSALMSGLAEEYPTTNAFRAGSVEPYFILGARARSEMNLVRAGLLGLSLMGLLIVCLNVSGMMLVRGALRERELSIRQAVGATRVRLIRLLLSEALLLASVGGVLGMAVLFGTFRVLAWWIGRPLPPQLRLDPVIFASCAALCLIASLMFGLAPAIRFSHPALVSAMRDEAGAGGRRVGRLHRTAAMIQVALVVPFLVLAGVALNQARTTATASLGFDTAGLAAVRLDPEALGDTQEARRESLANIQRDLEQAAGIRSVTVADGLPLDFRSRYVRVAPAGAEFSVVHATRVGEGYFDTMGIRLLAGRSFADDDREGAPPVVMLSGPLAAELYPNGDALGQPLRLAQLGSSEEQALTIVGVTADFVTSQVTTQRPQILLPLAQHPSPGIFVIARNATGTEMTTLPTAPFETAVRDVDPIFFRDHRIVTGEALVRNSVRDFMTQSTVATLPSAVVLALAALGVCGLIGFMVATRTREIAVRIALGASGRRVMGMVLTDVMKLVIPGLAGGFLVTAAVVRTTFFAFYPYTAVEPVVYAAAAAIAVGVALLAGLPSARRAASVEPMVAIRSE